MSVPSRYIHPTAVIGAGLRFLQGAVPWTSEDLDVGGAVVLPDAIYVGPFAVIGAGAVIGNGCVVDAYCKVDALARVGENSLVLYRGTVGVGATVGKSCVIGGAVSEYTVVEDYCRSFGRLVHVHDDSVSSWDGRDEPEASPIVRTWSFVGHDALVMGGIEIGPCAYVCAGATITRSVPPYHIGSGVNRIVHYSMWKGRRLASNPLFQMKV